MRRLICMWRRRREREGTRDRDEIKCIEGTWTAARTLPGPAKRVWLVAHHLSVSQNLTDIYADVDDAEDAQLSSVHLKGRWTGLRTLLRSETSLIKNFCNFNLVFRLKRVFRESSHQGRFNEQEQSDDGCRRQEENLRQPSRWNSLCETGSHFVFPERWRSEGRFIAEASLSISLQPDINLERIPLWRPPQS